MDANRNVFVAFKSVVGMTPNGRIGNICTVSLAMTAKTKVIPPRINAKIAAFFIVSSLNE